MFTGFNLEISEDLFENGLSRYIDIQNNEYRNFINKWDEELDQYLNGREENVEYLSGEKIISEWFPTIEADVFISHSHSDKKIAEALGGWMKDNFDLTCFIDSNVWGYVDHLLEHFNNEYSKAIYIKGYGYVYDLNDCNHNSQHINIMLLTALENMIDNVETVFFINTDNSISKYKPDKTYSPWIYAELLCSKIIRKKIPDRLSKTYFTHSLFENARIAKSEYRIEYNAELDSLIPLNIDDLNNWRSKYDDSQKNALDTLYSLKKQEIKKRFNNIIE